MKTGASVPWLNARQASAHLGFTSLKAFYAFLDRERARPKSPLRVHWLRGRMRFREVELDRCVESEPATAAESSYPRLVNERP